MKIISAIILVAFFIVYFSKYKEPNRRKIIKAVEPQAKQMKPKKKKHANQKIVQMTDKKHGYINAAWDEVEK